MLGYIRNQTLSGFTYEETNEVGLVSIENCVIMKGKIEYYMLLEVMKNILSLKW